MVSELEEAEAGLRGGNWPPAGLPTRSIVPATRGTRVASCSHAGMASAAARSSSHVSVLFSCIGIAFKVAEIDYVAKCTSVQICPATRPNTIFASICSKLPPYRLGRHGRQTKDQQNILQRIEHL